MVEINGVARIRKRVVTERWKFRVKVDEGKVVNTTIKAKELHTFFSITCLPAKVTNKNNH